MNIRQLRDNLCSKLEGVIYSVRLRSSPAYRKRVFLAEWTNVLMQNASVFTGMYAGVFRVAEGSLSNPERLLNEWCMRTKYKFEGQPVDVLSRKFLLPQIIKADRAVLQRWAALLLVAVKQAGIARDEEQELTLNDRNAMAYIEWSGEEIYVDDVVEVIQPAWYQNGRIIEQGHCHLKK